MKIFSGLSSTFVFLLWSSSTSNVVDAQCGLVSGVTVVTPSADGTTVTGSTVSSNIETAPDCTFINPNSPGEWFSFTSGSAGGDVTVSTCGSNFDTMLNVYSGCLTCVTANDDTDFCSAGGSVESSVILTTSPSTTYYVLLHGFDGQTGNYVLTFTGDTGGSSGNGDGGGGNDSKPDSSVNVEINNVYCFSERTSVQVRGRGTVAMKDLAIGDSVLAGPGGSTYEKVYAFGHFDPEKQATFVQLLIDDDGTIGTLELSHEHLVFKSGIPIPVRADSIKVGDELEAGSTGRTLKKVIKVGTVERKGVYAPLTASGTLVVDEVVASSYVSFQEDVATGSEQLQNGFAWFQSEHNYAHMALSPLRFFCMGISSNFCTAGTDREGMAIYVKYGIKLTKWAHQQATVVQCLILLAVVVLTGPFLVLEAVFGLSLAPIVLAIACAVQFGRKWLCTGTMSNKIKAA